MNMKQFTNNFHYTEGDIKHKQMHDREKAINTDIRKIDTVLTNKNIEELINLHREIDNKYQSCIDRWELGMCGYVKNSGFNYDFLNQQSLIDNLLSMKAKLSSFILGFNVKGNIVPHTNVTVSNINSNSNSNEIDITLTFEQAREMINEMSSLTNELTKEILEKITEIENIVKEKASKKSRWEKVKPVLNWLADKSFDVGMVLLQLLLKLNQ